MDRFNRILAVNLRSPIILTHLAVPHLEKTKGNIVNISSTVGTKVEKMFLSYGSSKAALNQLTKCCALELATKGIRVNAVSPGCIETPAFETLGLSAEQKNNFLEYIIGQHPLRRFGAINDIAKAVAYLASDDASFTTGIILNIDGGFLAACA